MDPDFLDEFEGLVDDLDRTAGSASFFEESFSSAVFADGLSSSTPRKSAGTPQATTSKSRQAAPLPIIKERLPCPECSNTYANERTLGIHVKMHRMRAVALRAPKEEELNGLVNTFFEEVVEDMIQDEKRNGVPVLQVYCTGLLGSDESKRTPFLQFMVKKFLESVQSQNALLPSSLHSTMLVKYNHFLNNDDSYKICLDLLVDILFTTDSDILNLFLCSMVLKLFNKLLAFYMRKIHGGEDRDPEIFRRSSDKINSIHFQQSVYFVSGFILNSIFLKAHCDTPTRTWSVYSDVLSSNFLASSEQECSAQVSLFTKRKDRGGLKHCSPAAFDFFLVLFDFLCSLENIHGSLSFALVDSEVAKHDVLLLLWDELVGSVLSEQQSLDLLILISDTCTKTLNRGILKRRLNEEFAKNVAQIAFRPRLAR